MNSRSANRSMKSTATADAGPSPSASPLPFPKLPGSHLQLGAQNATEKQTIVLAAMALAMTVFGGVFLLVLLMFRMTHKILQAIELGSRRDK